MHEAKRDTTLAAATGIGSRSEFPVFLAHPDLCYLDSAATSQKPECVIQALSTFYERQCAPVHRGLYALASDANQHFEQARQTVARFINAPESSHCVFTRSATESINLVANGWARNTLKSGDEVWVSAMEHHANYLPWQRVCRDTGAQLRVLPLSKEGEIIFDEKRLHNGKVKLIALTHVSNVTGVINPIEKIASAARELAIPLLVDACQSVGHIPVDVQQLDCAFMVFSAHKCYGPEGIGVLYGKTEYLELCEPLLLGGGMVDFVSPSVSGVEKENATTWANLPNRLEAGSPNAAGAAGLAAALNYIDRIGVESLHRHTSGLAYQLQSKLSAVDGVSVVQPSLSEAGPVDRVGIVSFVVDGIHPHDIAQIASDNDVAVRAGHHCAQPFMQTLGISGTVRASFGVYNNRNDVDALVSAVKDTIAVFRR